MKGIVIILILLFLMAVSAKCQELMFKGELIDFESHEPIQSVTIIESHTMNGAISDSLGKFQLPLTEDSATLEFHYVGYYQLELVNLPKNKESGILKIKMVRDYSKYINVDFGSKDVKPDKKRYKQVEMEVLKNYRLSFNGYLIDPIIAEDKIIFNLKNR